ncbi:MAG TPA: hypothetical protein VIC87_14515, partial [Vicinamibacteria bacterium]
LIGLPLVYQYLTTLRADAVPENADQLLENRGDGWRVAYPVGNPAPASGMPVVASVKWDTGAQARFGGGPVEVSLALTRGTLSSPQVRDTNGGRQLSGRVAVEPVVGLVMGVSAASGPYLSREVSSSLSPDLASREYRQRALGADAEWSRGHVIVRAEALFSEWDAPAVAPPFLESPLKVAGIFVEGRYKVAPNLYVAARGDHLAFTEIQGSGEILSWDAHVSRVEAGAGFALRRNLWLKGVYQYNWRDGGTVLRHGVLAGQLLFWF